MPFVNLIGRALGGGTDSLDTLLSGRTVTLVRNTVTTTAAVIGVGAAWILVRSDVALRRMWTVAVALPLVIPSYVIALTLISSWGRSGLIADTIGTASGRRSVPAWATFAAISIRPSLCEPGTTQTPLAGVHP